MELRKATIIEGIAATQAADRNVDKKTGKASPERFMLDGADISDLENGYGFANTEHVGRFTHLVGRVVGAKKVFSESDAETDYQKDAWKRLQRPFLAVKTELWDGVGHKEADSLAAIYRHYTDKHEEPPIRISVQGKTLEKAADGRLTKTQVKGIAITVRPCNRETATSVVGIIGQHGGRADMVKSEDPPDFAETESNLENVLELVTAARDMIRFASSEAASGPQCAVSLNHYRQAKARSA